MVPSKLNHLYYYCWYWLWIGLVAAEHTSNYAVVLSSSRYWFNYRHTANALSVYQILKKNGFQDDDIVLMLADEWSVNPRNPAKNHIYNTATDGLDGLTRVGGTRPSLLTEDTIIDYRSEDVTVEQFLSVLMNAPTDEFSNILIYINGHGGDQFFKFQDVEEIMSAQLGDVLQQLHLARKYHQILFVADTCQAFTLADGIRNKRIPNVAVLGSSLKGQSSYAHMSNPILGLSVIEKYTHYFSDRCERNHPSFLDQSVRAIMVEGYPKQRLGKAELGLWDALCEPNMNEVRMKHFWQQKRKLQDKSSSDHNMIRALSPLPKGLVQFMAFHEETVPDTLKDPLRTCNASQRDGVCQDERILKHQEIGAPIVEPTSLLFLVLVFGLVSSVAIGSTYL